MYTIQNTINQSINTLIIYSAVILIFFSLETSYSASKLTIDSVFIKVPGCCYALFCCDCKNNNKYKNSRTIGFEMTELLTVGSNPNRITGSTQLEKRMLLDISTICNNKEYCKFPLYSPEYHCDDILSKAYQVQIEYTCTSSNGETDKDIFYGVFKDKHSQFYISCVDSVHTTNVDRNYFSPSSNFTKIVCGTVIGAIINAFSEHLFSKENLQFLYKAFNN